MTKKLLKERFQKLAGIITEQMQYTGCSDPLAINYNENATGDSPQFGPFICQYDYGCADFEQWAIQLHGLALLNESLNNIPFPHIVTGVNNLPYLTPSNLGNSPYIINPDQPWSESEINNNPSSPSGIIDYICDWVCGTAVDMNPGQYCPACYAGASGFNFDGNLSNQDDGLWMCTCCKNIVDEVEGCTDPESPNYDETAVIDDGSCEDIPGCTDSNAYNYDPNAELNDGSCLYPTEVCNDPEASNYFCFETINISFGSSECDMNLDTDGSIIYPITFTLPEPEYIENNTLCEYPSIPGCTDPEADNYNEEANTDDGSCEYIVTCYICKYPPGPLMYGTPGELTSEEFILNYNPEPGDEYCPEEYEENSENLDCRGTHIVTPDEPPDPIFYRCKIIQMYPDGSSVGECVESSSGPFESLQECEDAGCGEKVPKKKRCYKCKGLGPVGFEFDDPPGCPKGWEDEPPTDCGCKDPLVDQWLVHPQIVGIHCCDVYLNNPGFEDSFNPGPECYNTWEELGGDPSFDPHQCCSGGSQGMPSLNKNTLKERLKKLAGIKTKK